MSGNPVPLAFTPNEMMTIAASRALKNDDVCFVGIGAPSAACNVARLTHAPDITLIYESGTIGTARHMLEAKSTERHTEPAVGVLANAVALVELRRLLAHDSPRVLGDGPGGTGRGRAQMDSRCFRSAEYLRMNGSER